MVNRNENYRTKEERGRRRSCWPPPPLYFLHLLFNSIFAISLSSVQFLAAAVADAAFDSSVLSFPLPKCIDVRRLCAYVNAWFDPVSDLSFFLFATIEVSFEIDQIGRRVYDDDDEEEEKKAKKKKFPRDFNLQRLFMAKWKRECVCATMHFNIFSCCFSCWKLWLK